VTGGHSLKPVIANGRGSAQRRFDVALFEEAALLGGVRPHASQTIGLELHRVSSAWSSPRCCRAKMVTPPRAGVNA
jgi:hypothetical protein